MAVVKLLKNQTNPTVKITLKKAGVSIPASGQYLIQPEEYTLWTTTDVVTEVTSLINSGDIVVNDGSRDLSAVEGVRYIEKVETVDIQLDDTDVVKSPTQINFEGDVTIVNNGSGKATVTIGETGQFKGKLIDFLFVSSGNTSNKWLGVGNGSTSSDTLPLIIPQNAELVGITFSNQDDNVDIDVEIYKNGALNINKIVTWEVRNKRFAWKTDFNGTISISQGDRISIFLKKFTGGTGDTTAENPIIEIFFTLTSDLSTNSGKLNGDI